MAIKSIKPIPKPLGNKNPPDKRTYYDIYVDNAAMHRDCDVEGCKRKRLNMSKYCYLHAGITKSKTCYIYFVLAVGLERVKIGYARNLKSRFSAMNTGSPVELLLVTHFRARPEVEAAIHKLLDEHRVKGEWFSLHDDVADIMEKAEKEGWEGIKGVLEDNGLYRAEFN